MCQPRYQGLTYYNQFPDLCIPNLLGLRGQPSLELGIELKGHHLKRGIIWVRQATFGREQVPERNSAVRHQQTPLTARGRSILVLKRQPELCSIVYFIVNLRL